MNPIAESGVRMRVLVAGDRGYIGAMLVSFLRAARAAKQVGAERFLFA